jgi:hypothetical protein
MNAYAVALLLANTAAMFLVARRWAPVPLLAGACYVMFGQVIEVGPFNFTILRVLIVAGAVRALVRGERLRGSLNGLDGMVLLFCLWMLISSLFHKDPSAAFVNRLGLVFDACGVYFLMRIFLRTIDDIIALSGALALLLLPIAAAMIYEKVMDQNIFAKLADESLVLYIRQGHVRAQGPFAHSILAGTVGGVCVPLMAPLWAQRRRRAVLGICSCMLMVFASASSGPILTAFAGGGAIYLWKYRQRLRTMRWLAVAAYLALDVLMNDPAYFIMARIDLAGGSTGWHRARLIQSAIEHISEWWLTGTDYTRHWMPSGVYWSGNHTDITNHYIQMGVYGGFLLLLLFAGVVAAGFSLVGSSLHERPALSERDRFLVWSLGAALFAHAVTFLSVSYFDQSIVFVYLTLAAIGSARAAAVHAGSGAPEQQRPQRLAVWEQQR